MSNWKLSALKLNDSVKGKVKKVKYVEFDFAIKIMDNAPASSNGYTQCYYHLVKNKFLSKIPYHSSRQNTQSRQYCVLHKREGLCL